MKIHDLRENAAGRITKQNTTVDVKPGETRRQAAKFGNKINSKNEPPLLHAKARKNSDPHTLSNLGLVEDVEPIKKPHPRDTLGVKRADMPQVHRDHYPELIQYLADHGNTFTKQEVHATELKPVQSEFSDEGVRKMMKTGGRPSDSKGKDKKPLIVSADNYIVDGHHRWLAAYNLDEMVPIMRSTLPIKTLFQLVKDFRHTTYKDIHEGFNATRFTAMEWACIEGGHDLRDLNENMSVTGTERGREERKRGLTPGTEAWFKHWFSRPLMKREDVDRLKEEVAQYVKEKRYAKKARRRKVNRD